MAESKTLEKGFEIQIDKQKGLIAISLFNLHRYSRMSAKKIREEIGGGDNIKDDKDVIKYVKTKEASDILSYQANIKLLTKLNKKYGTKNATGNLISDIQSDFGITADK